MRKQFTLSSPNECSGGSIYSGRGAVTNRTPRVVCYIVLCFFSWPISSEISLSFANLTSTVFVHEFLKVVSQSVGKSLLNYMKKLES